MDTILNQIEQDFASQITTAQDAVNLAQVELDNLVANREEKKKSVMEYFTALADKERAELIIAKATPELVASVEKVK